MAWPLAALGLGLQFAGSVREKRQARKAERKARKAAEFSAKQSERKAGEERAIGSMEAAEEARRGDLVESRARAVGAASGAGGYQDIISDIDAEAEYRMLSALFNREQGARDLEVQAEVARREGADAARAYKAKGRAAEIRGYSNLLSGAASLYERYG